MESFTYLWHGFQTALTPYNFGLMLLGITLGVLVGVLPGLGGPNGVAILLPLTYGMSLLPGGTTSAIILLSCIYWGALFGGAITSILFNIPGEAWSVATTFDGYPMAQQGRAGEALTAAFTGSFVGALFSVLLITFLAPVIANFALRFGPPAFFGVYFLTFASFSGTSRSPFSKTAAATLFGFILAAVGMDTVSGTLRLTFGFETMIGGFDFLVAVIGLFGLGEILLSMEEGLAFRGGKAKLDLAIVFKTWRDMFRHWKTLLQGCLIGAWMGVKPGGAIAASFMAYAVAKRTGKNPEEFGTGRIEGVIAPETAAHSAGASALLPMLTLGIPGSGTAAVLLGGLMMWGLQPGPTLFAEQKEFVWGLIASMYLSNVVGLIVVLATVPLFAALLRIPFAVIAPFIIVACVMGAYTVHNSMFDVWLMLIFGIIGYLCKKLDYPLAPLTLALILGDKMEDAFRQSLLGSRGSLLVFFSQPLEATLMIAGLILIAWPLVTGRRRKRIGGEGDR
ncbi:MAG: tripartite tricarboxylate transporter permease [Verrucomicrobia bacterium]|nr:tripartite tricarboxylate transporter permease [Verrucomicrobiota bacterium]